MLNQEPNPAIPTDYWCLCLDQTPYYTIPPDEVPFIEKIVGIYFYDASSRTYCCESTPSYWLEYIGDSVYFRPDTPDEKREELQEKYETCGGENCYMHCSDIDRLPAEQLNHYGTAENLDEVREYYQGNPVF